MRIGYFFEDIYFKLRQRKKITDWLKSIVKQEDYILTQLNYIFCSDHYLYIQNKTHLGHDTWTDVMAFDYAPSPKTILGDIYISIERIIDNAKLYKTKPQTELYIVMAHGLLHLLGYNDHTQEEIKIMRAKEQLYLHQLLLAPLYHK